MGVEVKVHFPVDDMSIVVNVITSIEWRLQVWVIAMLPVLLLFDYFFVSTWMQPSIAKHVTSNTYDKMRSWAGLIQREWEAVRDPRLTLLPWSTCHLSRIKVDQTVINSNFSQMVFYFSFSTAVYSSENYILFSPSWFRQVWGSRKKKRGQITHWRKWPE